MMTVKGCNSGNDFFYGGVHDALTLNAAAKEVCSARLQPEGIGIFAVRFPLTPMIVIQNTIVSDDVRDQFFVCNLERCKGACCVEGDLGAPLEEEELQILEQEYDNIKPFLTHAGRHAIEEQGLYIKDWEGDYSTTTIDDRECAYALYDERGILKCGIEQAYLAGATTFKKPISCHLYPIRISKYDEFDALNYDRWEICNPACSFGAQLGVPVYKFLKDPLIRKYGEQWYGELVQEIERPTSS